MKNYFNTDQIERDYRQKKIDYEDACEAVIDLLDISRGDAQGIVDTWEI